MISNVSRRYNAEPSHAFLEPLAGLAGRDCLNAAVVGQGNVALDCARVLAAPPSLIEPTDMTRRAVAALGELPQKRRVDVLGRRGATQAAFTLKECRELANLDGGALVVDEAELLAGDTAASLEEGTTRPLTRRRKFLDDVARGPSGLTFEDDDAAAAPPPLLPPTCRHAAATPPRRLLENGLRLSPLRGRPCSSEYPRPRPRRRRDPSEE